MSSNLVKIGVAAKYLGVTTTTLRNWDKSGKLRPVRGRTNKYRFYNIDDLEKLIHKQNDGPILNDMISDLLISLFELKKKNEPILLASMVKYLSETFNVEEEKILTFLKQTDALTKSNDET